MKLIRPEDRAKERPAVRKPRRQGIPASEYRYVAMECGHISTSIVQEVYSAFRVPGKPYFCEKCGIPQDGTPSVTPPPQPEKPPF